MWSIGALHAANSWDPKMSADWLMNRAMFNGLNTIETSPGPAIRFQSNQADQVSKLWYGIAYFFYLVKDQSI